MSVFIKPWVFERALSVTSVSFPSTVFPHSTSHSIYSSMHLMLPMAMYNFYLMLVLLQQPSACKQHLSNSFHLLNIPLYRCYTSICLMLPIACDSLCGIVSATSWKWSEGAFNNCSMFLKVSVAWSPRSSNTLQR